MGKKNNHRFYYGKSTAVTQAAAKSQCQSLGLRLAVFHTQADWETAKAFLNEYHAMYTKDKNVWIGIERDTSQASMVYKWIDGTPLSWGAFNATPWKDAATPVDDVTKACVKMEWGAALKWKHHSCAGTEDFLCEGFYLTPGTMNWNTGKSTCEGMGMQLASLTSTAINDAAITFINVQQSATGTSGDLWFGLSLSGDNKYHHEDGTIINSGMFADTYYNNPWGSSEPTRSSNELCIRLRSEGSGVFRWADYGCGSSFRCLCQANFVAVTPAPTTTTTTTTPAPTTTTTPVPTTTKPWWFVEYSEDGKAIGKNGKTFDKSQPPAKFGVIGLAIGFSTFTFLTTVICLLWFCCIRNKDDYRHTEEEEEEEEKPKVFSPLSQKPHGIQYIA